jgi:hypothetical protein
MYCPKCGTANDAANLRCANCGTSLPQPSVPRPAPAPVYCANCGTANDLRSSVCLKCGAQLRRLVQPGIYNPPSERLAKGKYLAGVIAGGAVGGVLLGLGVIAMVLATRDGEPRNTGVIMGAVMLMLLGSAACIVAYVVQLVFWYKCWKAIQDGQVRTTPGKAVGFLFIPFYNFYWVFECYWGFAKDFNLFVDRHGLAVPKLNDQLFLASCILTVVGAVPYVGSLASLAGGIIHLVMISQAADAVNSLVQA